MKHPYFIAIFALLITSNANALSLKEGLENVYQENPSLQSIKNQLNIATEQKKQAAAGFLPDVNANYSISDTNTNPQGSSSSDSSPSTGSVELSQPLFTGGATLANFKAAKFNQKASEFEYISQQQNIFQTASNAYLSVLTAQAVLEFNERQVATNTEEMKRIQQRFKLGDITLPNLKEFEARLSGYIAEKEKAYGDLLAAKSNFMAVFGKQPEDLTWPELKQLEEITIEDALQQANSNNPEIAKNKLVLQAQEQNIKIARANFLPKVAAVASWSNNSNYDGAVDTNVTTVGVQASMPLFAGGENKSKFAQAKYQKQQAQDTLSQNIRDIEASTAIAYNDVQVQLARVKALKVRLESFAITTDAVEKQDAAGEASIIDVLDARDDEFAAKVDLQLAKQQLVLAKLGLLASIGKFTYQDLNTIF